MSPNICLTRVTLFNFGIDRYNDFKCLEKYINVMDRINVSQSNAGKGREALCQADSLQRDDLDINKPPKVSNVHVVLLRELWYKELAAREATSEPAQMRHL